MNLFAYKSDQNKLDLRKIIFHTYIQVRQKQMWDLIICNGI